jgi:2-polyprenyl-3-methyl-5-hydroxy-6-metoxy-1,4-benzoquinol methylase
VKTIQKTWNEFWGKFLLVTFHRDNPDKWKPVEAKAAWVWENAKLKYGSQLLDLGCGSGMLDICLAKLGTNITAIDRIEPVLEIARKEAGHLSVKFIHGDIKDVNYPKDSFDCILFLETAGLMDKESDRKLIEKSFDMLKKNGVFIVDCPDPNHAVKNYWEKETSEGLLSFETIYEHESFIQTIIPILKNGEYTVELYDPYDREHKNSKGVKRYLYPIEELKSILGDACFEVNEAVHYWGEKYYALSGIKK